MKCYTRTRNSTDFLERPKQHLFQGKNLWRALVNTVMKLSAP